MEDSMCSLPLADYKAFGQIGCVYEITHHMSDKPYVGRTCNLKDRARKHIQELNNGRHKNPKMQHIHDKYGDMWTIRVLEECDENIATELEDLILSEMDLRIVLNCHKNAVGGSKEQVWTSEQRHKHSEILKSRAPLTSKQKERHKEALQNSVAVKENMRSIQHKAMLKAKSPESRAKAVESRKLSSNGKFFSDETRQLQIDIARDKAFEMITWIAENKKTRGEGIKEFGSSWGSLKKWLPIWEQTNGKLDLPLRASGSKNGLAICYNRLKQEMINVVQR